MSSLGRASQLSPNAHRLFRALIDGVVVTGELPDGDALVWATRLHPEELLRLLDELEAGDWLGRDHAGEIVALYPFSPDPTDVRVEIEGEERYAMCATDALGIAPMLERDTTIRASCVWCEAPIHVALRPSRIALRHPAGTLIVRRRTAGPAFLQRCAATRFACSPQHGQDWIETHGTANDVLASLEAAFVEARAIFGDAYSHGRSSEIRPL
jgi:hypothetical protein